MREQQADYDSPWKEALEHYFEDFMAFFFAQAYQGIAWSRGYEFLDKELQQVTLDAALGPRRVDKLVKVWRKEGEEAWVLIHVEVQGQEETNFAERMYVYNYRLFDRYHRQVASLAVLGDERPEWRPSQFGYELWGCRVGLTFPVVKLLDYRERWSALEQDRNPFAVVVMAYLKSQETRRDAATRRTWKMHLIRQLYERGYGRADVINLFRFIDWVMQLPAELEDEFWQEVCQYEEVKHMPYITSVERIGIEKGRREGLQEGRRDGLQDGLREGLRESIELGLGLKFSSAGLRLLPEVSKIEDVAVLRAIQEGLKRVNTLEELRRIYQ